MAIVNSKIRGESTVIHQDPDNQETYTLVFRPPSFAYGMECIQDTTVVIPTVPNGCKYIAATGGITGAEPIWKTAKNSLTASGNVKFKALAYDLMLKTGDIIIQADFIVPDGVTITDIEVLNGTTVRFKITTLPSTLASDIICRVTVLLSSGIVDRYDTSIIISPLSS